MTKKKQQTEETSPLRVPKAKNKLGLKINPIPMPHLQLVEQKAESAEEKPSSETSPSLPSQTPKADSQTLTRQTRQELPVIETKEITPSRNYQKVPNSLTKNAIPEGFFKTGKSKQLYDVLYSLTRGAIEPKRSVRISKTKLRQLAGIGSRITFDSIISHFESNGLLKVTVFTGEHEGNGFEVFTYDEIETLASQTRQTSLTSHAQKLDRLVCLETSQTRQSLNDDNKDIYAIPKTFLKTLKQIDDEKPILAALEMLNEATRAATGSDLTQKEINALPELFNAVIEEISLARLKTSGVTNYMRFAATHIRRQFHLARQKHTAAAKPFEPGSAHANENTADSEIESEIELEIEPLSDEHRKNWLTIYRPVVAKEGIGVLENLREKFTAEDVEWLIENLRN